MAIAATCIVLGLLLLGLGLVLSKLNSPQRVAKQSVAQAVAGLRNTTQKPNRSKRK